MKLLAEKNNYVGNDISNIDFNIILSKTGEVISGSDLNLLIVKQNNEEMLLTTQYNDICIEWSLEFKNKALYTQLSLSTVSLTGIYISEIEFIVDYCPHQDILEWRMLHNVKDIVHERSGFFKLVDLLQKEKSILESPCGIFPDCKDRGLFIGTIIPQTNICKIKWERLEEGLRFKSVTLINSSSQECCEIKSEKMYLSANKNVGLSFDAFAQNYPQKITPPQPQCGWSTWDYYYTTVTMNDIIENINALKMYKKINDAIKIIQIDDGWEYLWGEWALNYKFPGCFADVAKAITDEGYVAGIWTAPTMSAWNANITFRNHDMMAKNANGDPQLDSDTGNFVIDPTSPDGEKFIRELYTELYDAGFRYFKIDFVNSLLAAQGFYDKTCGVYGAIRRLFEIIRTCVKDSHVLGCSLPYEAGAWLADSGRTGIDIHNQWSHVEWSVESYMFRYWLQNRIWINDIDYLVVRGTQTSTEKVTTVLDPNANNPAHARWRSGVVFNEIEARTWSNIVKMSGSNVFCSDRISTLNEKGLKILEDSYEISGISARPLDMCCEGLPCFWLQESADKYVLTIINWDSIQRSINFNFSEYGLSTPQSLHNDDVMKGDVYRCHLESHESKVIQICR